MRRDRGGGSAGLAVEKVHPLARHDAPRARGRTIRVSIRAVAIRLSILCDQSFPFFRSKSEASQLEEYQARCAALKRSANYVEPSAEEKQRLKTKPRATDPVGDDMMREVRQLHNEKYQKELRSELFNGNFSTIRRRAGQKVAENLEQTVKQYSADQERLAEDMLLVSAEGRIDWANSSLKCPFFQLQLTKTLKDQTETANKIIKKDTEVRTSVDPDTVPSPDKAPQSHACLFTYHLVHVDFIEIDQTYGPKHYFADDRVRQVAGTFEKGLQMLAVDYDWSRHDGVYR